MASGRQHLRELGEPVFDPRLMGCGQQATGPTAFDGVHKADVPHVKPGLRVLEALQPQVRQAQGRGAYPTVAVIDSQSIKTTEKGGRAVMTGTKR